MHGGEVEVVRRHAAVVARHRESIRARPRAAIFGLFFDFSDLRSFTLPSLPAAESALARGRGLRVFEIFVFFLGVLPATASALTRAAGGCTRRHVFFFNFPDFRI